MLNNQVPLHIKSVGQNKYLGVPSQTYDAEKIELVEYNPNDEYQTFILSSHNNNNRRYFRFAKNSNVLFQLTKSELVLKTKDGNNWWKDALLRFINKNGHFNIVRYHDKNFCLTASSTGINVSPCINNDITQEFVFVSKKNDN